MTYTTYLVTSLLIFIVPSLIALALWVAGIALGKYGLVALALLTFVGAIVADIVYDISAYKSTAATVQIQVNDKERVVDRGGGDARYLVYAPNETFEDTDAFFTFGKTNSSDLYGQLNRGGKYNCTVAGWRVHFFSKYRNLIRCTPVQ